MAADTPRNATLTKNIRKFEEIGTHPAANHDAIAEALAFHQSIGVERKYARFLYLRDRWAKRLLAESDRVQMFTPLEPGRGGAIGVVGVKGLDMGKLGGWLEQHHHIVSTPMVTPEFAGLRVTPNVNTSHRRDRLLRRSDGGGDQEGNRLNAPRGQEPGFLNIPDPPAAIANSSRRFCDQQDSSWSVHRGRSSP